MMQVRNPSKDMLAYSEPVMPDKEIADIIAILNDLNRVGRSRSSMRLRRGRPRPRRRLFVELALDNAPRAEAGAVKGEAHQRCA
jgi:hypothetical protein